MNQNIEQLKITGTTQAGYRISCGITDPSIKAFKDFESQLKILEKNGDVIKKTPVKIDNSYATTKGGFWNEYKYEVIKSEQITPNVRLIINQKYRQIQNKIPMKVRKELNQAVKNGILGHIKKDGLCLECYYFINCKDEAINAVYNRVEEGLKNIAKVYI